MIRFSGGQQAGHTVVISEDLSHTFSNFGAGTFQGCSTFFSEHTTVYPVGIYYEREILVRQGYTPALYLHPLAMITTPWDVFANRQCEKTLANGSCGQGVGKTMERNKGPYQLRANSLICREVFMDKCAQIKKYYNLPESPELKKEEDEFFHAVDYMDTFVKLKLYEDLLDYKTLIFEGSQGIMLDMDHGVFPNVTYSNTTSKNAMEICNLLGITNRHIYMISRAYSTRHGKGDGEYYGEPIELQNTENETNINNKYQGEFLCTKLDYVRLYYAITTELMYSSTYKHSLVVTCFDQLVNKKDFNYGFLTAMINSKIHNIYLSLSSKGRFTKYFKQNGYKNLVNNWTNKC